MATQQALNTTLTNRTSIRYAGRRACGSWGRATGARRVEANRAVRRTAKVILRNICGQ
jgi:hypothetical protein